MRPAAITEHPAFAIGVGTSLLSVVRSLGAQGVECWACSSERIPGTVSRFARFWPIADPRHNEAGMIDSLVELARKMEKPPVIFTGCDQHAQALARHRDRLREVALPCIAHEEVVDLLVHKARFSAWTRKQATSHPESVPAAEFRPGGSIPFPVVAKPNHRGFANAAKLNLPSEEELHERRFKLIENSAEWQAYSEQNKDYLPHLLIQGYVRGTSASKYSVCIYADQASEIRALFVGRRLRGFPALYGDASLVQSDEVPDSVMNEVRRLVAALGYQGIAEFEFNQDEVTGEFHLLEINPRCWGWIGITAATQCDLPWIAYQDLTGQKLGKTAYGPPPGKVKMQFLVLDAANVFLRYRWEYPQWVMSPRRWWQSLQAERLVVWEFDRRDWRGSIWCLLLVMFKALKYAGRPALKWWRSLSRPGRTSGQSNVRPK